RPADHDPAVREPLDRAGIAIEREAMLDECGVGLPELRDRATRIPHVCVFGDRAERLPAALAADQDRNIALHRPWRVLRPVEPVEAPRALEHGTMEQAANRRDPLREAVDSRSRPGPPAGRVRRVLPREPTAPKTVNEPAVTY